MKKSIIVIVSIVVIIFGVLLIGIKTKKTLKVEDIDWETNSADDYGKWYGLLGHTNLFIFPEKIPASASDIQYSYCNDDNALAPSCHVFLKCTYNEENFKIELSRIKAIDNIKYDKENYAFEAYVSVCKDDEHEYALITGNNSIVYVFYRKGIEKYKKIEKKYLMNEESDDKQNQQFTIYNIDNINDYKYWPDSWKH